MKITKQNLAKLSRLGPEQQRPAAKQMNVMYVNDRRSQEKKCFTEKSGTLQCMLAVQENLLKLYASVADETVIDRVLRYGTAEISEWYLTAIQCQQLF